MTVVGVCLSTGRKHPEQICVLYDVLVLFMHILTRKENNLENQ